MRSWIVLPVCVVLLFFLPERGMEISRLRPASLLYVYESEGNVVMQTDMGDRGEGGNPKDALLDLKRCAPGIVFLDTAQHLILTEQTLALLSEISEILQPTAEVWIGKNGLDAKKAEAYLSAHPTGATLLAVQTRNAEIPVLKREKGRLCIAE